MLLANAATKLTITRPLFTVSKTLSIHDIAFISKPTHTKFLLQNSTVVKPVGDIQEDKYQREEQPGEKFHSVENLDKVILLLDFLW